MASKKNISTKKLYGQFMTTNYEYILKNMFIPDNVKNIIEPFAGNCDLIKFIKNKDLYNIEYYDIEPKKDFIIHRDTLNNPPIYENKFVLTNPPYLARNKSNDKIIFEKYDENDLYKCFIRELIINNPVGGIIIIPLNFWSSIRKNDIELRKDFLNKFKVLLINIFEENVFEDTSYSVCSFQFVKKDDIIEKNQSFSVDSSLFSGVSTKENTEKNQSFSVDSSPCSKENSNTIKINIYPSLKEMEIELNEKNDYIIGGHIYKLPRKNKYKIERLTKKNKNNKNTNILVKCLDDNSESKISMSIVPDKDVFIDNTPNLSARTYASLIITPSINMEEQKKLVLNFNKLLNEYRIEYNSLFLTNYRESKDIARKRISFDLIYNITEYILDTSS